MEDTLTKQTNQLNLVQIGQERFYKISNSDTLRPFFMSIVSDSNHWMFISSNGGLSAGRKNAEYALFPYYTDDKITQSADITGSKSIFLIKKGAKTHLWEPFSDRFEGKYKITRNLYKNIYGNKVLFEEENHSLQLTFRYEWSSSHVYGFVRTSQLLNDSLEEVNIELLDGIQNILPYGVDSDLQTSSSNLVDAYKRSELDKSSGLGIYALSAIIVDRAEPSEALKANTVWSLGLENTKHLLSSFQLKAFRNGEAIQEEEDVKAEKGAYFVVTNIALAAKQQKEWMIVANVNQNHSAVLQTIKLIKEEKNLSNLLKEDIAEGTRKLIELCAASDGMQLTADSLKDTRHFANTLFNIMRGGIFDDNYQIEKQDLLPYLKKANPTIDLTQLQQDLPDVFTLSLLKEVAYASDDVHLCRLCLEYLPLKFSRRHGDPSRPWNKFSINTQSEVDGSKILDYQGNWRDIFQNWEALALAYPSFLENMIFKFLNATTFDGYNPYRVTKDGFDWEAIEPDNPWSYIGYWGDHQIIYLLKLLELFEQYDPGQLADNFNKTIFVYANVPYKIKPYDEILKDPKDTIEFNYSLDKTIRENRATAGADAALLNTQDDTIYTVNLIEKILATVLAKLSNFIPEGGIWMNTQRPEWNDANNALVGNGVSMVTLYYLRRFLTFFQQLLSSSSTKNTEISSELLVFYKTIDQTLKNNQHLLSGRINNQNRKTILDQLGIAASLYREKVYDQSFSGQKEMLSLEEVNNFLNLSLRYLEHSIQANKRSDGLYHAYNLMSVENEAEVSISYLSEMLEGQVAVLSSGFLNAGEAVQILDGLTKSKLYRSNQSSYLLYPDKDLPGFLNRNTFSKAVVDQSELLSQLVKDGNALIIEQDVNGGFHFNGNFKNASDLDAALDQLASTNYASIIKKDKKQVLQIFEDLFNHKAFTGRSGTFYGYEGLGSIYWHMVSKLQLAVQECCLSAIKNEEESSLIDQLVQHYYEINEGIGVHKPPSQYGAFPTDPYSHTPRGKGAQQPGMTGQVKEDILCRFGELGVLVKNGILSFDPILLRKEEFLTDSAQYDCVDISQNKQQHQLGMGTLSFTFCQIPVIYQLAHKERLEIVFKDGTSTKGDFLSLSRIDSKRVFERTGEISHIIAQLDETKLRIT